MSTAVDDRTLEAWIDHPLVREAAYQAQQKHRGAGVVELLESLSCVLAEFDERFPGVPYRTVLEAQSNPDIDRGDLKRAMRSAGARPEDISLVLGTTLPNGELSPTVFAQIRDWPTAATWVAAGYVKSTGFRMMRLKNPLTETERRAADLLAEGHSISSASRQLGVAVETVRVAKNKLSYQGWLASQ
jgi:DNA-binding NarL/FixJ family response regulator